MFVPCFESCYLKYGKQYSEECNDSCDYAKAVLEKNELEKVLKAVLIYHNYRKCFYCKHYMACGEGGCDNYEEYELDLNKVKETYQIE